jgi:acyl-CoA dehydrogenase
LEQELQNGAWELPEELRLLRDTTVRFMDSDVKPIEDGLPHDAISPSPEQLAALRKKARDLGLWCFKSPAEYGGSGLSTLGMVIVAEESAKCRMGAYVPALGAFGNDPPVAIFKGNPGQIERYAVPTIRDGKKTFFAISEASGGSDPARAIRTRAEKRGDRYILNGSKLWITYAGVADWGIVFARTGAPGDRRGISCFIVETGWKGFNTTEVPVIRALSPYEITLEDVEVPEENLLGEEGNGFGLAEHLLVAQRIPYAAGCIGIAQAALDIAVDWAKSRETFGSRLADKQAIQWMIADSEVELRAARLLTYEAAWKADMGQTPKVEASMAKLYASEMAGRVVDRCIQILGGMGVSKEMPLERWYRELRIKRIGEGPSEVHRMVIARSLLGRTKSN